jgi:predicted nucleotidyltransferase
MEIVLPEQKLQELGVLAVYLFGSQAEGMEGNLSDVDIAVLFEDPRRASGNVNDLYAKLYDILTDAIDLAGVEGLDIVLLERAPLELQFNVVAHGKVLFSASDRERLAYEDRVTMLHADFKPVQEVFDKEILSRT